MSMREKCREARRQMQDEIVRLWNEYEVARRKFQALQIGDPMRDVTRSNMESAGRTFREQATMVSAAIRALSVKE